MPEPQSVLYRMRQRKVGQWMLAYLAGSWLVLQVLDLLTQNFDLSHVYFRVAVVLLGIGMLAALVLAWYHGEKGSQRVGGVELAILTAVLVLAAAAVGFVAVRSHGAGRVGGTAAGPTVEQSSIAVLPFVDMSPKHDQEYFSDGLTEELLNVLAQIPALRVAARTSSFAFKGKEVDIDSIGRALHVAHVLEGSVRSDAERVRITAQLIDARSGFHLWSDTYDRELKDVFAVQGEISKSIAGQLRLKLGTAGGRIAAGQGVEPTADPEAHKLLLQAVHLYGVATRQVAAQGVRLLEQALQRDSGYARAHAELAALYQRQAYYRWINPEQGYTRAQAEAERALALDPTDYRAHEVLGRIADYHRWDFRTAEEHFRKALESNPSDAPTHSHRAWMLMRLRRVDESLAEAKRATDLDPVSAGMIGNLAAMLYYAGRHAEANATWESARALEPTDVNTLSNLATGYSIAGRHADAARTAGEALTHAPDDDYTLATAAFCYARAGRTADARRILARLETRREISPYVLAGVVLALGDRERAFQLLEKAVGGHDDYAGDVAVDPVFASLHQDPRFQRMLVVAGLS